MPLKQSALLLAGLFFLAACRQEESPEATPGPVAPAPTATVVVIDRLPSATPSPEATPTASPTPLPRPSVRAGEPEVGDDGLLTLAEVLSPEGGWLVVRPAGREDGPVLGLAPLSHNAAGPLKLAVDPLALPQKLVATLHQDGGQPGVFEWPGADSPVLLDGQPVQDEFSVVVVATLPALAVSDQAVGQDGLVALGPVTVPGKAWVALYALEGEEPGALLGVTPLAAGTTEEVTVRLDWREATPQLQALLLADAGIPDRFEPQGPDQPLLAAGQPVAATFKVSLPPDVLIFDQPVVDGQIVVERVISDSAGWLVISRDEGGQPGNVIGWAPLQPGLNRRFPLSLATAAVTPLLYARIHDDTGTPGVFDFPASDDVRRFANGAAPLFTFRVDAGSTLVTRDQPASERVVVPYVVSESAAWLLVRAEEGGEPGPVIGQVLLPAGFSAEVAVPIAAGQATPVLYAMLVADAGTPGLLEYPDGPDLPVQEGGNEVVAPFSLIGGP